MYLRQFFWQHEPMTPITKTRTRQASSRPESQRLERFAKALRQAMVVNQVSERKMATMLGITSGTTQKYFRGEVDPLKVGTGVNRGLARMLGVSLDQLCDFYETGKYTKELSAAVGFEDVVSWMQTQDGAEHIAQILETAARVCKQGPSLMGNCEESGAKLEPFTWPLDELKNAGVSAALQERMGLTAEVLRALVEDGKFDDELVEAFSVATNLDPREVRKAFEKRLPIPQEAVD
jgi:transcriptional regulator with XRE-family HTH domain